MSSALIHHLIYQVYSGRWEGSIKGNQITRIETLRDLASRDWQRLKELGVTTIYLLGLFESNGEVFVTEENGTPLPPETYPRLRSPFALTNHTAVNPLLGNQEDLIHLIKTLHVQGYRVIVDFIPNHTSVSHPWMVNHPQYYQYHNGEIIREFSGDVAKLNYADPHVCREMIHVLQWIAELGFDGVRCDMAHLVPVSFWQEAIAVLKQEHSDFSFIAEAYPTSLFDYSPIRALYENGFDAVYNNGLFENLKKTLVNNEPVEYLLEYLKALPNLHPGPTVNYFANHDDPPLDNKTAEPKLSDIASEYLEAMLALILFSPGIGFIYNGTLMGKTTRLAHHWFEPLEKRYLETENDIPQKLQTICRLHQKIQSPGKDITYAVINQLLIITSSNYTVALNFSKFDQVIPPMEAHQGNVRDISPGDTLGPGCAEIWLHI